MFSQTQKEADQLSQQMTNLDLDIQFVSGLVAYHNVPFQECWHALENLV